MMQSLPLVLVPGLTCTARLYGPQVAALWPFGPVMVADHRRDDDMAAIATMDRGNGVAWGANDPTHAA